MLQAVPEQVEIFSTETVFHGRGMWWKKKSFPIQMSF